MRFVIVTGLSGAGKSQALNCFEDLGFFCVDNLPPELLPIFARLTSGGDTHSRDVAVVMDIRVGESLRGYDAYIPDIRACGYDVEILFLDARDDAIITRYKETRRLHPIESGSISESIALERRLLAPLREGAGEIIDTTGLSPQALSGIITRRYGGGSDTFLINIMSFGFKRGVPQDADMVLDARFQVNPFYIPELRAKSGLDDEVYSFVTEKEESREFLRTMTEYADKFLPRYRKEGKRSFTIAIGCTGGRHRSVALARALYDELAARGYNVHISHRDIEAEGDSIARRGI